MRDAVEWAVATILVLSSYSSISRILVANALTFPRLCPCSLVDSSLMDVQWGQEFFAEGPTSGI